MAQSALEVLQEVFGYDSFRGSQHEIIETLIQGGDALVLMPTGGGKSLCYQIPALVRPGTGVVVSPLIALMQDQVDALNELGVNAAYLNSTQDWQTAREVEREFLTGQLDLLYVAPAKHAKPRTVAVDRVPEQARQAPDLLLGEQPVRVLRFRAATLRCARP
jgi:ATP-dependent DNA helicase RecQ